MVDDGYNCTYINIDLGEKGGLNKEVHAEYWLVQLATRVKKRVNHWVRACAFELNGIPTSTHLNVFPLGSYNMLLGID